MKRKPNIAVFVILLIVAGCDLTSGNDPVLAKVGKSTINQSHLDAMMGRLNSEVREQKNDKLNNTILQGLVRTRVLAIAAEKQLSPDEIKSLDAKVQAYRDEFLAQVYIKKNIKPEPVSPAMVEQYYQSNLDEYTKPGNVNFEYIATTSKKLDDKSLNKVLDVFSKAKNVKDWKLYVSKLKNQKIPVEYKSAFIPPQSIIKELREHIEKLNEDQISDLIYGDNIYLVRVIKREPDIAKPVNQVSIEIRKKLAPQKLKQVLSQHIDQALEKINVEYIK